jgi:hypothetical protein
VLVRTMIVVIMAMAAPRTVHVLVVLLVGEHGVIMLTLGMSRRVVPWAATTATPRASGHEGRHGHDRLEELGTNEVDHINLSEIN